MAPRKKKPPSPKKPPKIPAYDYLTQRRADMTPLWDPVFKKFLILCVWPHSLLDAYKAGILTGRARDDAERIIAVRGSAPPSCRAGKEPSSNHEQADSKVRIGSALFL